MEKYYVYDIFTTNYKWNIIIGLNLISQLKLFFYPPITANNILPLRICCKIDVDSAFL